MINAIKRMIMTTFEKCDTTKSYCVRNKCFYFNGERC